MICRPVSLFAADIETNRNTLQAEIENKSICVIGGAGSISSSFIRALLPFKPSKLIIIDLNENGLVGLTHNLRSIYDMYIPIKYRTHTLNFTDPTFEGIFREEKDFNMVASFSTHKHVRSKKDKYPVQALIESNDIRVKRLLDLLTVCPPKHSFRVSTDKVANPANVMGASKRIMEDMIVAYSSKFKVTITRFANVALSDSSLPDDWMRRVMKKQPLVAPNDVKRYFVSPKENGQICALACILGKNGGISFPKLGEKQMLTFSSVCDEYIRAIGYVKKEFTTDEEAKLFASDMAFNNKSYPVVYFSNDTTGEEAYEEFYMLEEKINLERFISLGMTGEVRKRSIMEIDSFFNKMERIFAEPNFTKEEVVAATRRFLPNFEHVERGKNLGQKM